MDRRRTLRRTPSVHEPLSRVRLRTGRELSVVDVSNGGVLVEGPRLLPGTHVEVHVITGEGRVLVRSRVVRSYVWGLTSDTVRYRGALAFDRLVDTSAAGYSVPAPGQASGRALGTDYPVGVDEGGVAFKQRLTA